MFRCSDRRTRLRPRTHARRLGERTDERTNDARCCDQRQSSNDNDGDKDQITCNNDNSNNTTTRPVCVARSSTRAASRIEADRIRSQVLSTGLPADRPVSEWSKSDALLVVVSERYECWGRKISERDRASETIHSASSASHYRGERATCVRVRIERQVRKICRSRSNRSYERISRRLRWARQLARQDLSKSRPSKRSNSAHVL